MKHLPNLLTLSNLVCGCIAIAFILRAQPYVNDDQYWVVATTQAYYGSIFIAIAALFDLFDGMAARWLGVFSPIGKDLDSLADVVSFGVAPSMILMQMLWAAWIQKPNALDVSMVAMVPAFAIACFAALRLARFNQSEPTTAYFTGVPVPAIGLVVASFPLINLYNPLGIGTAMQNPWLLYAIIAVLSGLMVSNIKLFTLKLSGLGFAQNKAQYIWLLLSLIAIAFLKVLAIPFSFILYLLLSITFNPSKS
ncbi:MAG: CDP-alcohol phosphatidyltransferase family protein [Chitinophagaceae bacterium]